MSQGVAFLQFECSLAMLVQPAGAEHRLRQPGVVTRSWEEEGCWKQQPRQLAEAQSADSSYAAFLKQLWEWEVWTWEGEVWFWGLTLGESNLWERGVVLGGDEQGLGRHGMEEEPVERLRGAGM